MSHSAARYAGALLLLAVLSGCGSNYVRDGEPRGGSASIPNLPADAVPRPEPRSRYGNGPIYEVFGRTYAVMDDSRGFKERGVASWYGKKFHGNLTAMREPYDMYEMTAAHKTLPMGTRVRVTNMDNGRSVILRINDRGPYIKRRIIDVTKGAAKKLGFLKKGVVPVMVEVLH